MCLAYEENGIEKMHHCVKEIKEGCVTIIWAIFQPFPILLLHPVANSIDKQGIGWWRKHNHKEGRQRLVEIGLNFRERLKRQQTVLEKKDLTRWE